MSVRSIRPWVVGTLLVVSFALSPVLADGVGRRVKDSDLQALLARFDQVQDSIRTLSAQFTEVSVNPLLKKPLRARGRLFLTKPDSVRWEYTAPEDMHFIIAHNEYVGYFPDRKRAERRNIRRWSDHLFRFLGLGQASSELGRFYRIRREDPGPADKGTFLLVLEPKKRRVRKRVDEVRLWIDAKTFLPHKVAYHGANDSQRTLTFHNVRVNVDLSASLYKMDIPAGVTVTTGFSGLGAVGPGAARH